MSKILLSFMLFSFMLTQCSEKKSQDSQNSCEGIMCTQQFVSFSVTLSDSNGNSVPLDDYRVIDQRSGEDLTQSEKAAGFFEYEPGGPYPLYGDVFQDEHQNSERKLVFQGFNGGQEIISHTYTVAADCCHVRLVDGELNLSL